MCGYVRVLETCFELCFVDQLKTFFFFVHARCSGGHWMVEEGSKSRPRCIFRSSGLMLLPTAVVKFMYKT